MGGKKWGIFSCECEKCHCYFKKGIMSIDLLKCPRCRRGPECIIAEFISGRVPDDVILNEMDFVINFVEDYGSD